MDPVLRRRLEARFGERLTGPIRQRHDETEIRIGPGDVTEVLRALHDEPEFGFQLLADLAGVDTGERHAGRLPPLERDDVRTGSASSPTASRARTRASRR